MDKRRVCIGCGKRDTLHPSMLCGKCMMPSSNENATDDWERSHREPIDMKQSEHHTHYRCLPGPREDEE